MANNIFPYRKILIVGCCGAGKSTLAIKLGKKLNLPVIHLDKIWWLADWQHRTREEFDCLLENELQKDNWIIDGDYKRTFEKRLKCADFCIFLDYPQSICLKSAYERFKKNRGQPRPDLTDGCVEQFDSCLKDKILSYESSVRSDILSALKNSDVPHKIFISREQTQAWIDSF